MIQFLFFQGLHLVMATSFKAPSLNRDTQQGYEGNTMGMGGTGRLTPLQTNLGLSFHPRELNVGWRPLGRQKEIEKRTELRMHVQSQTKSARLLSPSFEADPSWIY